MNRRAIYFLTGMLIGGSGLFALILMLVGVQLNYLVWLDSWGGAIGLLLRLLMIMGGALLLVLGITNWEREHAEIRAYQQAERNEPSDVSSN